MLVKSILLFIFAYVPTLFLCVTGTLPSSFNQGSRRSEHWLRPGQHRPTLHQESLYEASYPRRQEYPLNPSHQRPGYSHKAAYPYLYQPAYPHSAGYPYQPDYQDQAEYLDDQDVYPERNCRYGRCGGDTLMVDQADDDVEGSFEDYDDYENSRQSIQYGCSCLLNVGQTVVTKTGNYRQRFQCNRHGLERCSKYCDLLFQDESFRANSRQDACDALGRDVYTPWYRRDQVCGSGGPHKDFSLNMDLCCVNGRPSLDCEDDE